MSKKHNALFDINDLNHRMMSAMITDSSVGGCTNAAKVTGEGRDIPSRKWCGTVLKSADPDRFPEHLMTPSKSTSGSSKSTKPFPKRASPLQYTYTCSLGTTKS